MGEYGGRYAHVAEYFAGLGFESAAIDQRGFGQSGGARGCVRRFSDFHRDLGALHGLFYRRENGLPVFLLGHSFGGLVSASYAAFCEHPPLKGLILSSPFFGIAARVPLWRNLLAAITARVWPNFTQPTSIDYLKLTHDRGMLEKYKDDPYIYHRISAGFYIELTRMFRRQAEMAQKLRVPLLVLQAGDDALVRKDKALLFYEEAASPDKELEVYEGFYHEILNETGRRRVLDRIGAWTLTHLPVKG